MEYIMGTESLKALALRWKTASEESMERSIRAGAPPNVVTEERIRYLVLGWIAEIEMTKNAVEE